MAKKGQRKTGGGGGRRRSDDERSDYSDDYSDYSYSSDEYRGGRNGGGVKRGNQSGDQSGKRGSPGKYDNSGGNGGGSKQSSPRKSKRVAPLKGASSAAASADQFNVHSQSKSNTACCGGVFTLVGLNRFFTTHDQVHHEEFDGAMRAMALMCTLMLLVPFQIMTALGHWYLDDIISQAQRCHGEDGVTYDRIYMGYRIVLLCSMYSSVCGMILSLFYFLFKRTNMEDYKLWHPKARLLTILVFFCTSFAVVSLVTLANWIFDYYMLPTKDNICNNSTTLYIFPGLVIAGFTFFLGFYLIL